MNKILLLSIIVASLFVVATVVYFSVPSLRDNIIEPNSDLTADTTPEGNNGGTSGTTSEETTDGTPDTSSSEISGGNSGGISDTTPTEEVPVSSSSLAIVNLGTAGNFAILSKSGISTTGTTHVTGDIGVSPIDSTAITGFDLIGVVSTDTFLTSSLVTGKIYASDLVAPTPTTMTAAIGDMETAYADALGRTNPTATELYAGDLSGKTLTPGLYKWGTQVLINNGVTLDCQGNPNAVFIFQIAQDLIVGENAMVTLSGGCQAKNIFWQVAGQATLGTTSNFKGNILSKTMVEMNTGAILNGRALAQTAVTLDANAVTISN